MQSYQLGYRVTTAGAPLNGGKAYFYLTGTTTLANVYEDDGLLTPLSNPVIADSAGFFPEIVYLDPEKEYRLVIKTSADVTIAKYSADPINTPQASGSIDGGDINENSIPSTALEPGSIEDYLGFTPQEDLTALSASAVNALLKRTGEIFPYIGSTAPSGALICNGGTIGSASSGGTALAHADAAALYALIWALSDTEYPSTDSGGGASTRGASASADFAANKRLPLPELRGEFIRGWDNSRGIDSGRVLGSDQAELVGPHTHDVRHATSNGSANDTTANGGVMTDANSTANVSWAVLTNGTAENRPRNIAFNYCIRY